MEPKAKVKGKKKVTAGIQTLFRVTYRTQINLIRIADTKANMILGINAMIISVLIGIISSTVLFSNNRVVENFELVIPIVTIMLTAIFSSVFAIRAVQPRLILSKKGNLSTTQEKRSLLFFENIYGLALNEYLETMKQILESKTDVYENMIIDIFNQATVLHRKYAKLRTSYVIFLVGFIGSILLFMMVWLFF
jgi:hypothetical protein